MKPTTDDVLKWARECFDTDSDFRTHPYQYAAIAYAAGAKAMQERCAKVCDDIADESKKLSDEYDRQEDCSYLNQQFGAEECAEAIRALGDDDD